MESKPTEFISYCKFPLFQVVLYRFILVIIHYKMSLALKVEYLLINTIIPIIALRDNDTL